MLGDLFGAPAAGTAAAVCTGAFLAALALMWAVVKNLPIRTKTG